MVAFIVIIGALAGVYFGVALTPYPFSLCGCRKYYVISSIAVAIAVSSTVVGCVWGFRSGTPRQPTSMSPPPGQQP